MLTDLLPRNVHPFDRAVRAGLGLGLLASVFVGPQSLWGLLGLVLLGTAAVGSCPLYTLVGRRSCAACGAA